MHKLSFCSIKTKIAQTLVFILCLLNESVQFWLEYIVSFVLKPIEMHCLRRFSVWICPVLDVLLSSADTSPLPLLCCNISSDDVLKAWICDSMTVKPSLYNSSLPLMEYPLYPVLSVITSALIPNHQLQYLFIFLPCLCYDLLFMSVFTDMQSSWACSSLCSELLAYWWYFSGFIYLFIFTSILFVLLLGWQRSKHSSRLPTDVTLTD